MKETLPDFRIPHAARSIEKGSSLKLLLDRPAIDCLAHNLSLVYPGFDKTRFCQSAIIGLEPLGIMERGHHLAGVLRAHLPAVYREAIGCILRSLTPPHAPDDNPGLAVFFYLPHVLFVSRFGLDPGGNAGEDPFEISMVAQYELTRRFSAEFSMRAFLNYWPARTLERLLEWTVDPDPHVRRLCSEGSRPRLPWAARIPAFIRDPSPVLPILEALKDDPDLYVRRSVANHLGDIAKDHLDVTLKICRRWLKDASPERRWLIRHALRHPAKKNHTSALELRKLAQ